MYFSDITFSYKRRENISEFKYIEYYVIEDY